MPKPSKRAADDSDSSDSGPDDRNPKQTSSSSARSSAAKRPKGDPNVEGQEPSWDLGKMKFAKVRVFKGQTYVDIREYYVDKSTMDTKPGKKGISLNCQQYQALKAAIAEIDQFLP